MMNQGRCLFGEGNLDYLQQQTMLRRSSDVWSNGSQAKFEEFANQELINLSNYLKIHQRRLDAIETQVKANKFAIQNAGIQGNNKTATVENCNRGDEVKEHNPINEGKGVEFINANSDETSNWKFAVIAAEKYEKNVARFQREHMKLKAALQDIEQERNRSRRNKGFNKGQIPKEVQFCAVRDRFARSKDDYASFQARVAGYEQHINRLCKESRQAEVQGNEEKTTNAITDGFFRDRIAAIRSTFKPAMRKVAEKVGTDEIKRQEIASVKDKGGHSDENLIEQLQSKPFQNTETLKSGVGKYQGSSSSDYTSLLKEIEVLNQKLAKETEKVVKVSRQAQEDCGKKNKVIEDLSRKLKQMIQENLQYSSENAKLQDLKKPNVIKMEDPSLQKEIEILSEKLAEKEKMFDEIVGEKMQLMKEVKDLKQNLEHGTQELNAKDAVIAKLREKDDVCVQCENVREEEETKYREKLAEISAQLKRKEKDLKSLRRKIKVNTNFQEQIDIYEDQLREVHKTLNRYRVQNRDFKANNSVIVKERDALKTQIDTTNASLKQMKNQLLQVTTKCSEIEAQNINLMKENQMLKDKNEENATSCDEKNLAAEDAYYQLKEGLNNLISCDVDRKGMNIVTLVEEEIAKRDAEIKELKLLMNADASKIENEDILVKESVASSDVIVINGMEASQDNNSDTETNHLDDQVSAVPLVDYNSTHVENECLSWNDQHTLREDQPLSLESTNGSNSLSIDELEVIEKDYQDDFYSSDEMDDCNQDISMLMDILDDEKLVEKEKSFVNGDLSTEYCPTWSSYDKGEIDKQEELHDTVNQSKNPLDIEENTVNIMPDKDVEIEDEVDFSDVDIEDIIEL